MKKTLIIAAVIAVGLFTQASRCGKEEPPIPLPCSDVACTMIFMMVTVDVKDQQGNPVILDEHYTIRESTGDKAPTQPGVPVTGTYTVLDDNFMSTLTNRTETFRFIGKKNGVEVVNEPYTISGDCCHVTREAGKTQVIVQ